ncbi:hypothetical protein [Gottfriedia acidiceleris]
MTSSGFTKEAREYLSKTNIILIDRMILLGKCTHNSVLLGAFVLYKGYL